MELFTLPIPAVKYQIDINSPFPLSSNAVFENVIERIDRALPELGLIENRDKWEDVLMEYGKWVDVLNNGNKRSMDCENCA